VRALLSLFARHGKLVLVAGLFAGILLPGLAAAMKPWLPELVAFLLFVAALRIGPAQLFNSLKKLPSIFALVAVYQTFIPMVLVALFWCLGFSGPLALAIVLMTSASSISGAPNLTILTGNDGAPAMRLLILGTALLPLTIIPVFWVVPQFGSVQSIFVVSGKLILLIGVATLAASALRKVFFPQPKSETLAALDGLSAIAMAVVVIGLMAAIGPALAHDRNTLLLTLIAACAINWGLQLLANFIFKNTDWQEERVSYSIIAGNRNMALFLAALPATVTDPILLFIGCYQIPMYLTPIVMNRIYKASTSSTGA